MADLSSITYLYDQFDMDAKAERRYEKAWERSMSTLDMVNNLDMLYADQGKMAKAEAMCVRALEGHENAVGADHQRTRVIAGNLNALRSSSQSR
jgi:Flp pilus assembly protein TadD